MRLDWVSFNNYQQSIYLLDVRVDALKRGELVVAAVKVPTNVLWSAFERG